MCATQRVLIEGHAHYLIYMERARSFESQARREARDDHFDDDKKEEKYGWRQQHVKPEFGRWSIVEAFPQPVHLAVMRRGGGRGCPLSTAKHKKKHQADQVSKASSSKLVSLHSPHHPPFSHISLFKNSVALPFERLQLYVPLHLGWRCTSDGAVHLNYSDSGTRNEISALSTGSRVPESEETMSRPNQAQEPLERAEDSSLQDQIFAVITCLPAACTYNVGRTFNHSCDDPFKNESKPIFSL